MGTIISAKYKGDCKNCGSDWQVGSQICYQKEPKAICSDKERFTEQGGTIETSRSQGNARVDMANSWTKNKPITVKLPECNIDDKIKQTSELWDQFFVVAHHRAHDLYPEEPTTSDRFGQIRSKMMDQFMKIAEINK